MAAPGFLDSLFRCHHNSPTYAARLIHHRGGAEERTAMTDDEILVAVADLRDAYRRAQEAEDRRAAAESLVREEAAAARACWDEIYRLQGLLAGRS